MPRDYRYPQPRFAQRPTDFTVSATTNNVKITGCLSRILPNHWSEAAFDPWSISLIGEPPAAYAAQYANGSRRITYAQLDSVAVPEVELCEVKVRVLLAAELVDAVHGTLRTKSSSRRCSCERCHERARLDRETCTESSA